MKQTLRTLFAAILTPLESGAEPFTYAASHRVVLKVMGFLFSGLASLVFWFARGHDWGYFLPVLIFGVMGFISLIVGFLGADRAVAKIWGSDK